MKNALIHIADVASRSRSQSRRDAWIQARAESAINGDDDWKNVKVPVNPTNQLLRLRKENAELKAGKVKIEVVSQDALGGKNNSYIVLHPYIVEDVVRKHNKMKEENEKLKPQIIDMRRECNKRFSEQLHQIRKLKAINMKERQGDFFNNGEG